MRLAIVGSRNFTDYDKFEQCVNKVLSIWGIKEVESIQEVVSGGARGTDTLAELWAKKNGIPVKVLKPDWSRGRGAGLERNTDIVNNSTHYIAFPSHSGSGTQDTIRKAEKKGLIGFTIYID